MRSSSPWFLESDTRRHASRGAKNERTREASAPEFGLPRLSGFCRRHKPYIIQPNAPGDLVVELLAGKAGEANEDKACPQAGGERDALMRPAHRIFLEVVGRFEELRRIVGVANLQARPAVRGNALSFQVRVELVHLARIHLDVLEHVEKV